MSTIQIDDAAICPVCKFHIWAMEICYQCDAQKPASDHCVTCNGSGYVCWCLGCRSRRGVQIKSNEHHDVGGEG